MNVFSPSLGSSHFGRSSVLPHDHALDAQLTANETGGDPAPTADLLNEAPFKNGKFQLIHLKIPGASQFIAAYSVGNNVVLFNPPTQNSYATGMLATDGVEHGSVDKPGVFEWNTTLGSNRREEVQAFVAKTIGIPRPTEMSWYSIAFAEGGDGGASIQQFERHDSFGTFDATQLDSERPHYQRPTADESTLKSDVVAFLNLQLQPARQSSSIPPYYGDSECGILIGADRSSFSAALMIEKNKKKFVQEPDLILLTSKASYVQMGATFELTVGDSSYGVTGAQRDVLIDSAAKALALYRQRNSDLCPFVNLKSLQYKTMESWLRTGHDNLARQLLASKSQASSERAPRSEQLPSPISTPEHEVDGTGGKASRLAFAAEASLALAGVSAGIAALVPPAAVVAGPAALVLTAAGGLYKASEAWVKRSVEAAAPRRPRPR